MIETTELSPLGEDFLQTFTVTSPERDSQSPVSTNYSGGGVTVTSASAPLEVGTNGIQTEEKLGGGIFQVRVRNQVGGEYSGQKSNLNACKPGGARPSLTLCWVELSCRAWKVSPNFSASAPWSSEGLQTHSSSSSLPPMAHYSSLQSDSLLG